MAKYESLQKEAQLKNLVFDDYFDAARLAWEQEVDNIDFIITNPKTRSGLFAGGTQAASIHYLWGEVKLRTQDVYEMLTQLILTCKKTYDKGDHLAPPYLCCFDDARIAFVPFHIILPVFNAIDINWTQTPSRRDTKDFEKALKKVKELISSNILIYNFGSDDSEIKEFIKTHIGIAGAAGISSPITKDNFVQIYIKWVKQVKPTIDITKEEWAEFRAAGILDGDFYRADVMSEGGNTITDKLQIVLKNDNYKFQKIMGKRLFSTEITFNDGGAAYTQFWTRYKRPPAKEYHKYIIDRRDVIVPENIREMKGSYFTPSIWVKKSHEYLAKVFGDGWQDEYYIWDCAAGTGNLLAGLKNKYNIWASDIDQSNIDTINALLDIDESLDLLPTHVFQFDFLNDSFDKLPENLRKIINDDEKRKKLIIYINPPYAEAANYGSRKNKAGVAAGHSTSAKYKDILGRGINELFANFFIRIYDSFKGAKLASFGTMKYINSQNFVKFREYFTAEYKKGFICRSNTFDNVKRNFPIGFLIWDLDGRKTIKKVTVDVYDNDKELKHSFNKGKKSFYPAKKGDFVIDWLRNFYDTGNGKNRIGYLRFEGTDFQNNNHIFITSNPSENDIRESKTTNITRGNLIEMCIYLAIRHCIDATWLNNRDQFLYPNNHYQDDIEFKNNCLIFSLFHSQNHIKSKDGTNHWIPFTEKQVGAKEKFESNFMSEFIRERAAGNGGQGTGFSSEAQSVYNAGLALWKYYHAKINVRSNNYSTQRTVPVNASFYDIRAFFQGRDEGGKMNTKSADETYNALIAKLRDAQKILTAKIEPKVYEYGFLKK